LIPIPVSLVLSSSISSCPVPECSELQSGEMIKNQKTPTEKSGDAPVKQNAL